MNRRIPRSMIDALPRAMKSLALANAPPSIKQIAALVTVAENGNGVIELIDELIADDLRRLQGSLSQNLIVLGKPTDCSAVQLSPYGHNMLVAGPSGCGKSTLTAGIIERLIEKDYQVCVIDPEGDYGTLRDVVALGNQRRAQVQAAAELAQHQRGSHRTLPDQGGQPQDFVPMGAGEPAFNRRLHPHFGTTS